ncbi:MAG: BON domain-containing protein [Nitrospiraceae bacterium]|nr:MAG: BON domain-containing protein [Nitrospiraceae bacterium]
MLRARQSGGCVGCLIFILFLLPGCVALTGETAGENIDDAVITTEIKAKLAGEKVLHTTRVGVKTERGVVYLTGSVDTADDRSKIVEIAKNVKGVRDVVNRIEVRP